jgi:hypothetical protein
MIAGHLKPLLRPVVIALLIAPGAARADQQADSAALLAAAEAAGCIVTAENGDAVLAASGLSDEQVMATVAALYESGQVTMDADGNMKVMTEACQ